MFAVVAERPLLAGEYASLGLLALRPMHGYEMACFFEESGLSQVCPVEQSTLYTYLRNIEARGLVRWSEEREGLRPPRKVYALTRDGDRVIDQWLRRPVTRMREVRAELLIKLFFLERLDEPAHRLLVRAQIEACEAYLAGLDQRAPVTAFGALVARSKRSAAEATIAWLRDYLAELEAGLDGGEP